MLLIERLKFGLITIEKTLAILSLFLLLAFSLIQIVLRNFFDTGIAQLDTISRHLVLYLAFMGAALVTEDDRHIKVDLLRTLLSHKLSVWLTRPLLFIGSTICLIFAWQATRFWMEEWHYATPTEYWQTWLEFILPFGFGVLGLHFLLCGLTGQSGRDTREA